MTTWSRDRIHPWAHPSGRVREALTHQSTSALPGPKSRTRVTSLDLADTLVHGCQIFRVTHDPVEIPLRYHMTQSDVEYSLWRFPLGDPIFRVSTLVSPTELCFQPSWIQPVVGKARPSRKRVAEPSAVRLAGIPPSSTGVSGQFRGAIHRSLIAKFCHCNPSGGSASGRFLDPACKWASAIR